jgi:hypothetical protein
VVLLVLALIEISHEVYERMRKTLER